MLITLIIFPRNDSISSTINIHSSCSQQLYFSTFIVCRKAYAKLNRWIIKILIESQKRLSWDTRSSEIIDKRTTFALQEMAGGPGQDV